MHTLATDYLVLLPDSPLPPAVEVEPFKAVVIIEAAVSPQWRGLVSEWLVRSGCLYMMAWGSDCSLWDDSVDEAKLERFDYGDIPDDKFVMTTWHENEELVEVFWFAKHTAVHPHVDINRVLLLHIATESKSEKLLAAYADA